METHQGEGSSVEIRTLARGDVSSLILLEREVWGKCGIESINEDVGIRWIEEGICLGAFEQGELVAYAYAETVHFSQIPPYSQDLLATLESYASAPRAVDGNALHGVSMAARRRGAGEPLLHALIHQARRRGLEFFVSLARLEGLGRFVDENAGLEDFCLEEIACLYAIQAVSWIDPALVGDSLALLKPPPLFPKLRRKDRVVSRFARIGKSLWGVAKTSFDDPQSLGFSALLVLTL
jgi:hypothetical protein